MKKFLCISLFRKALLLVPALLFGGCAGQTPVVDHQSAYQAYNAGDYELAAEKFTTLVQAVPKDAELWFRLGNSHARAKHPKEAVNAYENALLRDPQMSKAWYNMGIIYLQAALKTLTEMEGHVPVDDPVGKKGRELREGVFSLLEGRGSGNDGGD